MATQLEISDIFCSIWCQKYLAFSEAVRWYQSYLKYIYILGATSSSIPQLWFSFISLAFEYFRNWQHNTILTLFFNWYWLAIAKTGVIETTNREWSLSGGLEPPSSTYFLRPLKSSIHREWPLDYIRKLSCHLMRDNRPWNFLDYLLCDLLWIYRIR